MLISKLRELGEFRLFNLSATTCYSWHSIKLKLLFNWRNLKFFFSRTTGSISSKLGTKHPWVMGIQVCSNEGPCPFPIGDNYEIEKIHWQKFKIFFSRTIVPISTKHGTKHPWVKGIQVWLNEGPHFFSRGDNYDIAKIHWRNFKIFLQCAIFNQIWHKAFIGDGDLSLFKGRTIPFCQGVITTKHLFYVIYMWFLTKSG